MQMRKTSLWDGDGLGNQARVAVNLAPLAGQTPAGLGGDVAGKTAPHESGRNNTTGGEPYRGVEHCENGQKYLCEI